MEPPAGGGAVRARAPLLGAAHRAGCTWLLDFSQVDDLPGFRDVELGNRVALNTLQVLHRRARRIVGLDCIAADPNVSVGAAVVADLLEGKVVLVDVSGLGSTEEVLVASFLTRKVMDHWSDAYLNEPDVHERMPVVAVVLEEAQRVLSAGKDRDYNLFPRVAREGRKFKVGLCAITQQPKLLDDELLSQFNTFFVLGLADEKDRNILRGSSKQDISALGPEIQTLMPGECLVVNLHAPFAVPAKVHLYDELVRATEPAARAPRGRRAQRRRPGGLTMKVAAIGDAHLGRSYLPVTTPEGLNQREVDFEQAFTDAVDVALGRDARRARVAGRHLRPPASHLPVVPHRAARAGAHPRARRCPSS